MRVLPAGEADIQEELFPNGSSLHGLIDATRAARVQVSRRLPTSAIKEGSSAIADPAK